MADNFKHLRFVWDNMKRRCCNPNVPAYKDYGARGIKIEWKSLKDFRKDMLPSYRAGLTIERIDNNGNYSKENCRWATRTEQARNTRNIAKAKKITHKGLTLTIREWAERLGIKRTTLDNRIRLYGWSVNRALEGGF